VADLAAVARDPGQRPSVDDQAAAHPDLPGNEEDVVRPPRGASSQLGEGAQVGFVGDRHRRRRGERFSQPLPERDVSPAEVRGGHDGPVRATHDRRRRDAHAEGWVAPRACREDARGQGRDVPDGRLCRQVPARPVDAQRGENIAAEPHGGDRERIDRNIDGQHVGSPGVRPHDRRRAAGNAVWSSALLRRELRGDQLAGEGPDRAAGEPGPRDELRSRHRAAGVQLAHDRAQVGAPNRLAALTDRLRTHRHGFVFLSSK
jgi:hypothetical protein